MGPCPVSYILHPDDEDGLLFPRHRASQWLGPASADTTASHSLEFEVPRPRVTAVMFLPAHAAHRQPQERKPSAAALHRTSGRPSSLVVNATTRNLVACGHGSDSQLGHHLGKENAEVPGSIPGAAGTCLTSLSRREAVQGSDVVTNHSAT